MMTYEQFSVAVKELLLDDAEISGTEAYLDRLIRISLLKILEHFPMFRPDAHMTFGIDDCIDDGYASVVALPLGTKIREMRIVPSNDTEEDVDTTDRLGPLQRVAWEERDRLINGFAAKNDLMYAICPDRITVYVHPKIEADRLLKVRVEAMTTRFAAGDVLHVPDNVADRFAECASDYIRSSIAKDIERNAGLHQVHLNAHKSGLRALYTEANRS
jgi:hypothetical protein